VLNHVCLHQTVIGQESMEQFKQAGDQPDIIVGCVGGGSNMAGISFPYLGEKLRGKRKDLRAIAVEPSSCPTLTKGIYAYDYGDTAGIGPIAKMYTLGHDFVPPAIHAGGLRYHGDSPIRLPARPDKVMEAVAVHQTEVFQAAVTFARSEGIIPAPESAHAIRVVIDERHSSAARRTRRRRSSSTSPATAIWISPPTTTTLPASSRTSSTRTARSRSPSPASRSRVTSP